jgi:hypothetical protein
MGLQLPRPRRREEGACVIQRRFVSLAAGGSHAPGGPRERRFELELGLVQSQMAQKPMLRGEVGARALRNQEGRGKGRKVVHTSVQIVKVGQRLAGCAFNVLSRSTGIGFWSVLFAVCVLRG